MDRAKRLLICLSFCLAANMSFAIDNNGVKSIDNMSLEELRHVKVLVPAAFTKLTSPETPASITVITAEDIKHTPARNIYDLIEAYVPGAIWMNYEDGPQLGIRGNIANRNFKYLLGVNGRIMNNKGHYGAKSELEQWDLGDIQRIEIVRGPGSVIYGPGAVAGVINIITHDANSAATGLSVTGRYINKYDSKGLSISHGFKAEKFKAFTFASVTRSSGDDARNFMGTNDSGTGYVGKDVWLDKTPLDYFADYEDDPQIKLHLDIAFLDHWRFWFRYTQQGSNWKGNEVKTLFPDGLRNQGGIRDRQWTNTLQYDDNLRDNLSISVMLSIDSSDVERRRDRADRPDPDHTLNKEINFSETEIFLRSIVNWTISEQVEIALGTEYSRDFFRPGWNDSRNNMRLGERGHIISGPSSNALEPGVKGSADRFGNELFVGYGWHTNTYSLFSEANISLSPRSRLLLSARTDKNTYSDSLLSPRIALISEIRDNHQLKFIVQQARRMSTAGQLYALDKSNKDSETETLTGIELIYTAFADKPLSISVSAFRNDSEVIAWDNSIESTNLVGDLQLFGIEPQLNYQWAKGEFGISYSFIKQLDWQLADNVPASGISYSDYNQPLIDSVAVQTGVGNDVNNWPNQALKLTMRFTLSEQLKLHVDARWLWDYQGLKDGLTGLTNAVQGSSEEAAVNAEIKKVEDAGAYDDDIRLNASLDYQFSKKLSSQVFVQNLLDRGDNKRYSYDFSGNNQTAPHRVRFVEEPRTVGLSLHYQF